MQSPSKKYLKLTNKQITDHATNLENYVSNICEKSVYTLQTIVT